MKYDGIHSCGHEGKADIIGPGKDREWKVEKYFSSPCPECCDRKREAEIERKNMEFEKLAEELMLPELTGTQKQIDWANGIRIELIEKITVIQKRFLSKPNVSEKWMDIYKNILNYIIKSKTSASYYIENRNIEPIEILKKVTPEYLESKKETIAEEASRG